MVPPRGDDPGQVTGSIVDLDGQRAQRRPSSTISRTELLPRWAAMRGPRTAMAAQEWMKAN